MSSSFQQNWIHSIRTSFAKVMAVLVFLSGSSPEMVRSLRSPRSLRPKGPGVSGPLFFAAKCLAVVRYWYGVRRYPGDGPESPAHRSLRPKGPGISGPKFFSALCIFVVRYWIGVRNTPGEWPESPADRSLRPQGPESPASPMTQQAGVSGHLIRSLRPGQAPTASFWGRL